MSNPCKHCGREYTAPDIQEIHEKGCHQAQKRKAVKDVLVSAWFHALRGPDKKSQLKPGQQFQNFANNATDLIFKIINDETPLDS